MTEQDQRNIDVVRRMYVGDESERAAIAPNIVWHVPGHNPVSGDYHGFQEYTHLMPSRMAPLSQWDFTLEAIMVNGDFVMTTIRVQGERKGKQIDMRGGHLMRISEDGLVVEGWGFTNEQDELDDFAASINAGRASSRLTPADSRLAVEIGLEELRQLGVGG